MIQPKGKRITDGKFKGQSQISSLLFLAKELALSQEDWFDSSTNSLLFYNQDLYMSGVGDRIIMTNQDQLKCNCELCANVGSQSQEWHS